MSTYPNLCRKPWSPHAQPAGMQYTIVLRKENKQYALKLHLQERISVEEGEHRVCLEFAPAGTYINCAEE